jgi:hypothetical protein
MCLHVTISLTLNRIFRATKGSEIRTELEAVLVMRWEVIMQAMCEELKRLTVSKIVTIPGAPSLTDRVKMWNVASDKSAYQSVLWCQQYSVTGS